MLTSFYACSSPNESNQNNTQYVNPFIGTGGYGHTYPGASTPFGMVQLSPDNGISGWDEISGYFYPNNFIGGFSHTHFTGTGVGDLYDIQFMPAIEPYVIGGPEKNGDQPGIHSRFSHDNETAYPGYYSVLLDDYNIKAELTATDRTGMHRYTFPKSDSARIILDLLYTENWDYATDTKLDVINDSLVTGYRFSTGWAPDQRVYFAAKFSKPFDSYDVEQYDLMEPKEKLTVGGTGYKAFFNYKTEANEEIILKVALSAISTENALENLEKENPDWDFDAVQKAATAKWENELSEIDMQLANEEHQHIFYTALYQSMLAPTLYQDVNGDYRGADLEVHNDKSFTNYSTFSLWDTFRAAHPLYTLMHPERADDMVKSMLVFTDEYGYPPVWPFAGNETDMMIGYHAVPVIVDAILKGVSDVDPKRALEACLAYADSDKYGINYYREYGYLPFDLEKESVSRTLEYAYDDYCIAQLAKHVGDTETYERFTKRASYWKNLFDKETGFFRPKDKNGNWLADFHERDYSEHYTESNAWHYLWFVPHDVDGLIEIMGGKEAFVKKLDVFFASDPTEDEYLPDFSTGMIGQYVHGNEPDHHTAYLYALAGADDKAEAMIRRIQLEQHFNRPDGICGNEDCGQMSAWYVYSALGFYPVNPCGGEYVLGSPMVKEGSWTFDNGNTLNIQVIDGKEDKGVVDKVYWNNEEVTDNIIHHTELIKGGTLKYVMK